MSELDNTHLTYIGGPTILIEVGTLRLLTDPTLDLPGNYETGAFTHSKLVGPAVSASEIGSIDAVLLSRDHHFDNLDRAGRKLLSVAKRVITTPAGAQRLQRNAIGLESWQSFDVSASDGKIFSITSTPARHGPVIGERGPVAGFLISYKDSTEDLIYVSGDTVWYEGVQETLRRYPNIRVGILFVGAAQIPGTTCTPHVHRRRGRSCFYCTTARDHRSSSFRGMETSQRIETRINSSVFGSRT